MSSDKKKPQPAQVNIQIQIDEEVAQGAYSNLVMIKHTETEFVYDFIYVQPQQPKAKVRARIICSPRHAKQLLRALGENIKIYEERFGPIPLAANPDGRKLVH